VITLPENFKNEIRILLGAESESFFLSLNQEPITSIRKNPFKISNIFENEQKVEWCDEGRYLPKRPSFIADPLFHAGAYYVQESSSMFLHQVLKSVLTKLNKPVKVLDLCAAPGGKSTLINSLLNENDLLVSNEIIRSRVDMLDENLMRWGQSNVFISNNDPKDFSALSTFFDIVLIDAPCSGEGMFRKDKKAIDEWSESNVQLCVGRQQRIIEDVLPSLKPGGFLIYSTCTFNDKENEENVKWMIDEFGLLSIKIETNENHLINKSTNQQLNAYRFLPHKVKGEGLFMAVLQKPHEMNITPKYREQKLTFVHRKNLDEIECWLQNPKEFEFIEWNKNIHAISKNQVKDLAVLAKYLHLKNAGILMGEMMNGKLLPSHYLALSNALSETVKSIHITKDEAIKYLRKDTLILNDKYEQGIYLLKYEGLGIGWVKVLQNRINNYLPTHLRILKEI
jgi:16S rRNA C967 or C1407 C5-methylase (RsmB/RsmF family)/NOL1/NOP2/fmu family ribosome biogenesis protein